MGGSSSRAGRRMQRCRAAVGAGSAGLACREMMGCWAGGRSRQSAGTEAACHASNRHAAERARDAGRQAGWLASRQGLTRLYPLVPAAADAATADDATHAVAAGVGREGRRAERPAYGAARGCGSVTSALVLSRFCPDSSDSNQGLREMHVARRCCLNCSAKHQHKHQRPHLAVLLLPLLLLVPLLVLCRPWRWVRPGWASLLQPPARPALLPPQTPQEQ
jgi:hypothetical protein